VSDDNAAIVAVRLFANAAITGLAVAGATDATAGSDSSAAIIASNDIAVRRSTVSVTFASGSLTVVGEMPMRAMVPGSEPPHAASTAPAAAMVPPDSKRLRRL
jgi:hypothetical protein